MSRETNNDEVSDPGYVRKLPSSAGDLQPSRSSNKVLPNIELGDCMMILDEIEEMLLSCYEDSNVVITVNESNTYDGAGVNLLIKALDEQFSDADCDSEMLDNTFCLSGLSVLVILQDDVFTAKTPADDAMPRIFAGHARNVRMGDNELNVTKLGLIRFLESIKSRNGGNNILDEDELTGQMKRMMLPDTDKLRDNIAMQHANSAYTLMIGISMMVTLDKVKTTVFLFICAYFRASTSMGLHWCCIQFFNSILAYKLMTR
jgi:hypothetical protein